MRFEFPPPESPALMSFADPATDLDILPPFDFDPRTRVVFGSGTVGRLGELAKELGGTRVLLVTDPGIQRAGHSEKGLKALIDAGLEVSLFEVVQPNPTTDDVDRGLVVAKKQDIDFVVAIGGGSAMDCAKGINFLLTNGGQIKDYWGVGKAKEQMLPMIAVPTTAGTGSEAQSFALIADAKTHMKMACGDKKAACRVAILDPDLTLSMPNSVTAATGIDAISHAVESYVTTKRNAISQLFARRAWRLLAQAFPIVTSPKREAVAEGNQQPEGCLTTTLVAARGNMLLGSHLAGAAIENSMLGATHALANPLTAHFGTKHGVAIGVMLPHVIRYNSSVVGSAYGRLAADLKLCAADDPAGGELVATYISRFATIAGLPSNLRECQVDRSKLPQLADEAARQWTGTFNPRPVDAKSLLGLYEAAFDS